MDSKINIVCWKWHPIQEKPKTKKTVNFTAQHVNALFYMLKKHVTIPFDLICVTDDWEGILSEIIIHPLWDQWRNLGGCFTRLVCFKKDFFHFGERFISIDLDCVITANIDDILLRKESFVIWKPENDHNRIAAYCGSLWLLEAGKHPEVYDSFDPRKLPHLRLNKYLGGTDQLHISKTVSSADIYSSEDGIYNFVPDIFRRDGRLPDNAKIVFFNGRFMPDEIFLLSKCPWISTHYPLAGTNTNRNYSPKALRALRPKNSFMIKTKTKAERSAFLKNEMLSFVLFWWGNWPEGEQDLGIRYIERLMASITIYTPSKYRYQIVLFTDYSIKIPGVQVRNLNVPSNLRWNLKKMYMYSEEANLTSHVICFDLDTIIKGSLEPLIEQVILLDRDDQLITCEAAYKKGQIGGSVIGFKPSMKLTELLWIPIIRKQHVVEERTKGSERMFYRQQLLGKQVLFWENEIPGAVASYKKDCKNGFPAASSVIRFHGHPRPHEVVKY